MEFDDQGNLIDLIAANFFQECESCMEESWNDGFDGTSPVGFYNGTNTFPGTDIPTSDGRSSYGLYDMAGNVSEYLYEFEYDEDQNIPLLIGGGWNINITELAIDNGVSTMYPIEEEEFGIFAASGFRCVRTK
jgi:formylglycine-generating enzyme required for sulfatase activity